MHPINNQPFVLDCVKRCDYYIIKLEVIYRYNPQLSLIILREKPFLVAGRKSTTIY